MDGHVGRRSLRKGVRRDLVVRHEFAAPIDVVFGAWADPDRLRRWLGPRGFTVPVCEVDFRPGGVFQQCLHGPEGHEYAIRGLYHEIEAPRRIVFTDGFVDEHGHPVSGVYYGLSRDWPAQTQVVVTFERTARDKTRVTVRHCALPVGLDYEDCERGWLQSLDRLDDCLHTPEGDGSR